MTEKLNPTVLTVYAALAGAYVRVVRSDIEGWSPIPESEGPRISIETDCEACGDLRTTEHASVASGLEPRLVDRAHEQARRHAATCRQVPKRLWPENAGEVAQ